MSGSFCLVPYGDSRQFLPPDLTLTDRAYRGRRAGRDGRWQKSGRGPCITSTDFYPLLVLCSLGPLSSKILNFCYFFIKKNHQEVQPTPPSLLSKELSRLPIPESRLAKGFISLTKMAQCAHLGPLNNFSFQAHSSHANQMTPSI